MKHLKTINELYKKTYSSAAEKLKDLHPKRAEDLEKWSEEKGESEKMDKDFYHAFTFSDNPIFKDAMNEKSLRGKFYITGSEKSQAGWATGYKAFNINMTSEYGNNATIIFVYSTENPNRNSMKFNWENHQISNFYFNRRTDALEFRKYLVEDVAEDLGLQDILQEIGDGGKIIPSNRLNINKLYSTK